MNEILSYAICFLIILLIALFNVKGTLSNRNISYYLKKTLYYRSILITIVIMNLRINIILKKITNISTNYLNLTGIYNDISKIALFVVLFFVIQICVYKILKKIIVSIFKNINKENTILMTLLSLILGTIKGFSVVLILFFIISMYNNTLGAYNSFEFFKVNKIYSQVSSIVEKGNNTLTDEVVENFLPANKIIIYYNGVTLEEGIKSTDEIDEYAKELTKNVSNDMDKSRILYSWIGSNIEYDYDRAEKALNNEKVEDSGAISAFKKRSGICFDYSCLYVAMARAVNLKVRLLTGTAYDGEKYGPHAWNEVYISEIDNWIPVDTTFYLSGDYFNSKNFYEDHITDSIAGEW